MTCSPMVSGLSRWQFFARLRWSCRPSCRDSACPKRTVRRSRCCKRNFENKALIKLLGLMEHEHANLHAALQWAVARPTSEITQRLESALLHFWQRDRRWNESRIPPHEQEAAPLQEVGARQRIGILPRRCPMHAKRAFCASFSTRAKRSRACCALFCPPWLRNPCTFPRRPSSRPFTPLLTR